MTVEGSGEKAREPLEKLAESFIERHRRGERPEVSEYAEKYPDLAEEIRKLFPAMLAMEGLAGGHEGAERKGEGSWASPLVRTPLGQPAGLPRRQLGEYVILGQVGRGGMGVVYDAVQESLGRHVALKVLPQSFVLDENHLKRFRREAQAAARLQHGNIVPVFGIGEDAGVHYYAMQFIRGESLDRVIREMRRLRDKAGSLERALEMETDATSEVTRSLLSGGCDRARGPGIPPTSSVDPLADRSSAETPSTTSLLLRSDPELRSDRSSHRFFQSVARIGHQVAGALDYAHGEGVIHRDIKPSNLILDVGGTVWVTDFGLAKAEGSDTLTGEGDIVGTLAYMAPERLQGWSDPRSDIFGLGATLYEILTLEHAFEDSDRHRLMRKVAEEEPVPPRKLHPRIPRDLETIILKAMEKDPGRRYGTAAQMERDLGLFLEGKPIASRRTGRVEKAWRWCWRNPAVAGLAIAVATLLVVTSIVASIAALRLGRQAGELKTLADEKTAAAAEAVKARQSAETTLVDMYTASGITAADLGDPAGAVLWFASAACLPGQDPERQEANRIRARTWSRGLMVPVRVLSLPGQILASIEFHPDERHLFARSFDDRCSLWDLPREEEIHPWGEAPVTAAAWSPDGAWLVFGTKEGLVRIQTFPGGDAIRDFQQPGPISGLTFSRDGRLLAMASKVVRIWDFRKAAFATPDLPHPDGVQTLAFDPAGARLATGCADNKCRVFDATGVLGADPIYAPFPHHSRGGTFATHMLPPTFVENGRVLLLNPELRQLECLDASTGKTIRRIPIEFSEKDRANLNAGRITAVKASPDGDRFFLGSYRYARLWEARNDPSVTPLPELVFTWSSAAFSPDGKILATGVHDSSVRYWSLPEARPLQTIHMNAYVGPVAFSSRGRFVAAAEDEIGIKVLALDPGTPEPRRIFTGGSSSLATLSPDGQYVATTGVSNRIGRLLAARVYQASSGEPAGPPLRPGGLVLDSAFSPDGKILATVSSCGESQENRGNAGNSYSAEGVLNLWDWSTGRRLSVPREMSPEPRSVTFSPDGRTLGIAEADGGFSIFSAGDLATIASASGSGKREGTGQYQFNGRLVFAPDGGSIYTLAWWNLTAEDGEYPAVRWYDARSGERRTLIESGDRMCQSLRFSPDSRFLATAGHDRAVRIHEVRTGRVAREPLMHPDTVYDAVFSDDGNRLLTGSRDGMVRLWDWREGRLLCPPLLHSNEVYGVAFMPRSRWIMTASFDGTARAWDLITGKPITPPLSLGGMGWFLKIAPDGRHAVAGGEVGLRLIDLGDVLDPLPLDAGAARILAEICSGKEVREGGGFNNLTAEEWLERWRGFRKSHPSYHDRFWSAEVIRDFHRSQARSSEEEKRWEAAVWHLDRLVELEPESWRHRADRARAHAALERWGEAARDHAKAIELKPDLRASDPFLDLASSEAGAMEILARVLFESGRRIEAVSVLEEATALPEAGIAQRGLLQEYRQTVLPEPASYATVDSILDDEESIVPRGAIWRFFKGDREPSPGLEWTEATFDDSAWQSGASGFGYGEADLGTELPDMRGAFSTLYIRRKFSLSETDLAGAFVLSVLADDGFISWVNGTEVGRYLAGPAGSPKPYDALSQGSAREPPEPQDLSLDPGLLRVGENIMALQVLNLAVDSSDLILLPVLQRGSGSGTRRGRALLEQLRLRNPAMAASSRADYLEGRLLCQEGKWTEATERFRGILEVDVSRPEPYLRLAECLQARGDSSAAEKVLREALEKGYREAEPLWDLWIKVCLADLKLPADAMLGCFPSTWQEGTWRSVRKRDLLRRLLDDARKGDGGLLEEVRPAFFSVGRETDKDALFAGLRDLRENGAIRIRCGGPAYRDHQGRLWSADRHFVGGTVAGMYSGEIASTDDDPLYQTERFFTEPSMDAGYRIPIPNGLYRVTLHFAEVFLKKPSYRQFDARIEGETVLEGYIPGEASFATAEPKPFNILVRDGFLDINYASRTLAPKFSAIEVQRIQTPAGGQGLVGWCLSELQSSRTAWIPDQTFDPSRPAESGDRLLAFTLEKRAPGFWRELKDVRGGIRSGLVGPGGGEPLEFLPRDGALLVGFAAGDGLVGIRPIFLSAAGDPGDGAGTIPFGERGLVRARPGFAVGGLVVSLSGRPGEETISGIRVRFQKIAGYDLDPGDGYEEPLLGSAGERDVAIGGAGNAVIGFVGRAEGKQASGRLRAVGLALVPLHPAKPVHRSPEDGGVASGPVVLEASPFVHREPGVRHVSSHWKVQQVFDGVRSMWTVNRTTDADLTKLELPPGKVLPDATYRWSVSYTDSSGRPSEFSRETVFKTGKFELRLVHLDLSGRFNVDAVMAPGDATADGLDGQGEDCLTVNGFDGTIAENPQIIGLPKDRRLGFHLLGDYGRPNAIHFGPTSKGILHFDVPKDRYVSMRFLLTGVSGCSEVPAVFGYSDGTSVTANLVCHDWYPHAEPVKVKDPEPAQFLTTAWPVREHLDRFFRGKFTVAQRCIYEVAADLDSSRDLTGITLDLDGVQYPNSATRCNLFAVTGILASD